jgi:proline dehydrogenase
VAYADKGGVDANYARLMEQLLLKGNHPAIAMHDQWMITRAKELAQRQQIGAERFDFEMLFGVRRDLQLQLVAEGYRVRIYLPYGQEWYPYLVRRLAERPANLGFFVRALLSEAMAGRRNGHP